MLEIMHRDLIITVIANERNKNIWSSLHSF